jgi:hypothetical protein
MSESPRTPEPLPPGPSTGSCPDDILSADCPLAPDSGYLPPLPRRLPITSLQQWIDLCA